MEFLGATGNFPVARGQHHPSGPTELDLLPARGLPARL